MLLCFSSTAQTIYLTRHYEKTEDADPSLTSLGIQRAHRLADHLAKLPIQRIYSTPYKRTRQTATPLSEQLDLTINEYSPHELAAFAEKIKQSEQDVLIVGHSNTTPQLIDLLGGPKIVIGENDYGTLYQIDVEHGAVTLSQTTITTTK